jgi:hypothetical protein
MVVILVVLYPHLVVAAILKGSHAQHKPDAPCPQVYDCDGYPVEVFSPAIAPLVDPAQWAAATSWDCLPTQIPGQQSSPIIPLQPGSGLA